MVKKHAVSFTAKKPVKVAVGVKFKTGAGKKVAFEGHKKVKKPVAVRFKAKDK